MTIKTMNTSFTTTDTLVHDTRCCMKVDTPATTGSEQCNISLHQLSSKRIQGEVPSDRPVMETRQTALSVNTLNTKSPVDSFLLKQRRDNATDINPTDYNKLKGRKVVTLL